MENNNITVFKTSELPLVAFLRMEGYTITEIVKVNDFKVEFLFNDVDRELLAQFNTSQCLVEPRQFASSMHQQMKSAKIILRDK